MTTQASKAAALLCAIAFALIPLGTRAEISPVLHVGYDAGGATIGRFIYTDRSEDTLKANQGFRLGAGISYLSADMNFESEMIVSYKAEQVSASNGDLRFTRFPLDVLAFYRVDSVRMGAGVTYHYAPKLKGNGFVSKVNIEFEDAVGMILQVDYLFGRPKERAGTYVGLRYTWLDYKMVSSSTSVEANGIGLHLGYRF